MINSYKVKFTLPLQVGISLLIFISLIFLHPSFVWGEGASPGEAGGGDFGGSDNGQASGPTGHSTSQAAENWGSTNAPAGQTVDVSFDNDTESYGVSFGEEGGGNDADTSEDPGDTTSAPTVTYNLDVFNRKPDARQVFRPGDIRFRYSLRNKGTANFNTNQTSPQLRARVYLEVAYDEANCKDGNTVDLGAGKTLQMNWHSTLGEGVAAGGEKAWNGDNLVNITNTGAHCFRFLVGNFFNFPSPEDYGSWRRFYVYNGPDLDPDNPSIIGGANSTASQEHTFRCVMRNRGDETVGSYWMQYQIDYNRDGTVDYLVGPGQALPAIAGGGSDTIDVPYTFAMPAGNHRVRCAQTPVLLGDTNTSNNTSGWTNFTIDAPPTVQLQRSYNGGGWSASNVTIPSTGGDVNLRWVTGGGPVTSCSYAPNSGSQANWFNGGPAVSGVANSDSTVTLPSAGNTQRYTVTCTGPGGSASDSLDITRTALAPADLVPSAPTGGANIITGQSLTFTNSVSNTGGQTSGSYRNRHRLERCSGGSCSWIADIANFDNQGGLAVGASRPHTGSAYTFNTPGTYRVTSWLRNPATNNALSGQSTSNDHAFGSQFTVSAQPDLDPEVTGYPSGAIASYVGVTHPATAVVENIGAAASTQPYRNNLYVHKYNGATSQYHGGIRLDDNQGALSAGGSRPYTGSYTYNEPGTYRIVDWITLSGSSSVYPDANTSGHWTASPNFNVLPNITNLRHSCNAAGTQVTISWDAAPAPTTQYYFRFRNDDGTTPWNGSRLSPNQDNNNVTGTSRSVNITPGNPYRVWVHARDNAGMYGRLSHLDIVCNVDNDLIAYRPEMNGSGSYISNNTVFETGQAIDLRARVYNGGSAASLPYRFEFRLTQTDGTPVTNVFTDNNSGLSDDGLSSYHTGQLTPATAGNYLLQTRILDNNSNVVFSSDIDATAGNDLSVAIPITVTDPTLVDLTPDTPSFPNGQRYAGSRPWTFNSIMNNIGSSDSGPYGYRFELDYNSSGNDPVSLNQYVPNGGINIESDANLAAGGSEPIASTRTMSIPVGSHRVRTRQTQDQGQVGHPGPHPDDTDVGNNVSDWTDFSVYPTTTGLDHSCNAAGTEMTISWDAGVAPTTMYFFRFRNDDGANSGAGSVLDPNVDDNTFVGTSITVPVTPGNLYRTWVHSRGVNPGYGIAQGLTGLSCTPSECHDGIDNDGDGLTDAEEPSCPGGGSGSDSESSDPDLIGVSASMLDAPVYADDGDPANRVADNVRFTGVIGNEGDSVLSSVTYDIDIDLGNDGSYELSGSGSLPGGVPYNSPQTANPVSFDGLEAGTHCVRIDVDPASGETDTSDNDSPCAAFTIDLVPTDGIPDIYANPRVIRADDDNSPDLEISWDTDQYATCSLSGPGLPATANTSDLNQTGLDGSADIDLNNSATFSIDCGGGNDASVRVEVLPQLFET